MSSITVLLSTIDIGVTIADVSSDVISIAVVASASVVVSIPAVVVVVSAALSAASASISRAMRSVLLPDRFNPRSFNNSFRAVAVCCNNNKVRERIIKSQNDETKSRVWFNSISI